MQTVLVTGATGFIASHLLPVLHQKGWQITAAVRNNFAYFAQPPSIPLKIIKVGEIDGNTNWQEALEGINTVIHLAARAHILDLPTPNPSLEGNFEEQTTNPEAEFIRVNTEGTANLVKQSIKAGVKQFIFISSIGAMATLKDEVLTENSPCQPDTSYGMSKLKAEKALIELSQDSKTLTSPFDYAQGASFNWTIFRPTLVYGQGNPGNMERLMKLVKLGLPLPLGGVKNRRSFIYVGNLVDAIAHSLNHPGALNQTFLISDGEDISTPELVIKIAQQMEKPCQMIPVPPKMLELLGYLGDLGEAITKKKLPFNRYTINRLLGSLFVDSSHIQNTLKWQPPYTIDYGIEKTINP